MRRPAAGGHRGTVTTTVPHGPLPTAERALGPDLARGAMLLFIALANSHYFLQGDDYRGGFPLDGTRLDDAVAWATSTFVDGRAFPMFGALFGYGIAQIVRRNAERTGWGLRFLLWRRSAVLIVIGFLHAVLLFSGDILTAYGVLLLIGAFAVRWKDRWLLIVAAAFFVLCALPSLDSFSIATYGPDASMLSPDLATILAERPSVSLYVMALGPVGFAAPFLVGLWAGRRRVLERPDQHRRLLVATAILGVTAAVLGAQPAALMTIGAIDVPGDDVLSLVGPLHDGTGVLGGLGYAALITLLATRPRVAANRAVRAVAATGQRSMTCYLMQSVAWTVLFTPFLLDLSGRIGVAANAAIATGVWLVTVVVADRMARAGLRGPFEVLTRRVTYWERVGA